jgi:hypothetical protein
LVVAFPVAEVAADCAARGASDEAGATPVDRDDDVLEPCGHVRLEVDVEGFRDLLGTRAAVNVEDDWIFLFGIEVRGPTLYYVKVKTVDVNGGVVESWQLIFTGHVGELMVFLEDLREVGIDCGRADHFLPGDARAVVAEKRIPASVREGDVVATIGGGIGERLKVGAVEFDAIDMAFDRGALGADEVNEVIFEVDTGGSVNDFPFTLS